MKEREKYIKEKVIPKAYFLMKCFDDRLNHGDDIRTRAQILYSQQSLQLLEPDYDGGATHKSYYCSMRQEIHKKTQPAVYDHVKYIISGKTHRISWNLLSYNPD